MALVNNNGPVQSLWFSRTTHWFLGTVWGGTESVKHYFSLSRENKRLTEENERLMRILQEHVTEYGEIEYENSVSDTVGRFHYIPAKIAKSSNNRQHNYLILNKGEEDGVRPMSGVITNQGIVGIVNVVSRHYCYVLSFKNNEVEVSARLGRDGAVGILTWDGYSNRGAILNGIPQHVSVESGDTIYTSGFSDHFPSDIPLGVAEDKSIINGAYYRIKVQLFEDATTRRYATIVESIDREEIKSLEDR